MDQALYDRIQELQQAALFKAVPTSGMARIVNAPYLGSQIASAFERISRFGDQACELGRLGIHQVHDVCLGIDVAVDSLAVLEQIAAWTRDGAINVRRMAGGRC